jgi:hypothetical protein
MCLHSQLYGMTEGDVESAGDADDAVAKQAMRHGLIKGRAYDAAVHSVSETSEAVVAVKRCQDATVRQVAKPQTEPNSPLHSTAEARRVMSGAHLLGASICTALGALRQCVCS